MREFHGLLFLGMGQASLDGRKRLHQLLDKALELSGGLQQPDPLTVPPDPEGDRIAADMADEVKDRVRDIAAALTGREISFGAVLPYPPEVDRRAPKP